jgi:hypothetical protein
MNRIIVFFAAVALLIIAAATLSSLEAASPSPSPTATPSPKRIVPVRPATNSPPPAIRPRQRSNMQVLPIAPPPSDKVSGRTMDKPAMVPQKTMQANVQKLPTFSGHNTLKMPDKRTLKQFPPLSAQEKLQALDGKSTVSTFTLGPHHLEEHGCDLLFVNPTLAGDIVAIGFPSSTANIFSSLRVYAGIGIQSQKEFIGQTLLFDCLVYREDVKADATYKISGPGGVTQSVPANTSESLGQHLLFVWTVTDIGVGTFEISCDADWTFQSCEVTVAK